MWSTFPKIKKRKRWRVVSAIVVAALLSSTLAAADGDDSNKRQKPAHRRGVQDVTTPSTTDSSGAKYYALVIGNNNYRHIQPSLKTAVSDAQAVAQLLHDRYGFRTRLLVDATRDDILTALVIYRKVLGPNSNLLIYYAGHGYLDRDADEAYWWPVDADQDNNMNWISTDDITRDVRAVAAKHVLVISDSCYSGAILRGPRADAGINLQEHMAYVAKKQASKSRNWMASGSVEPVIDTGAPGHSIFAAAVIQGLKEMRDTQFAASDLFYSFVQRKVAGNVQQMPQYGSIRNSGDDLGDFIFSRSGAPVPGKEDIPPVISVIDRAPPDIPPVYHPTADNEVDRAAVNAILQQYQEGRKRKDAGALWKIWPTAPVETKGRIEAYFKSAASIRTGLDMGPPEIASDGMSATVSGQIHEAYTPKNGEAPPPQNGDITFSLKKNNGVWTIVDVK